MSLWSRFVNVLRPGRLDDELDEEIADHIARRTAALQADGIPAAEAQRRAAAAFGNLASIRDQGRDVRTWLALDTIVGDVRYAIRGMRRSPAFTVTALLSLGLTTGAATALYSIVDAALLRPLPVVRPDRLFALAASESPHPGSAPTGERTTFSFPLYEDLRAAAADTASLALFSPANRVEVQASSDRSAPIVMATTQFVSENAWEVLRVPPALGRVFADDDGRQGAPAVAVVSWDFWQQRLGGDPGVIEKTIRIDGRETRIVGVAARGFFGVEPGTFVDAWRPAGAFDPGGLHARTFHWAHLVGRLADDATLASVQARLQVAFLADRVSRADPSTPLPSSADAIVVRAAATGISGSRQARARPLGILLAIATVTLLIASANVGSLLLARASGRAVEMAVRTSLGAGRTRLVRQLATEHLVLALAAGVVGWTIAWFAGPSLAAVLSRGRDPLRLALTMDVRVLLFSAGVCALSCVFFGLLPAIAAMSHAPMPRLRAAPIAAARAGLGRTLMAAQVAFAYCLVASGAAFLFSMSNLSAIDPGFDDRGVTVLTVGADRMMALPDVQQFQQRIGALPGVEGAAVAWWAIFEGSRRTDRVVIPGATPSEREEIFYRVSPAYFATLRTPLLEGRDFTFGDTEAVAPIPTIVNGAFARRYLGGDAVLGREFQRLDGARHRIVGLAADSSYGDLRNGPDPIAYFPMKPPRWFTLYVRSGLDVGTVAQMVRRETAAIGSGAHLIEAVTLHGLVGSTIHRERLLAGAGAAFAGLALLLAAIGVFGFLNYAVSARASEIAIRAALGASPRSIVHLVLTNVLGPVGLGIAAGTLGSTLVLRLGQSLLFGVRAVDPLVLTAATVVFPAAAGVAAALPARRAASVDPTGVLKA